MSNQVRLIHLSIIFCTLFAQTTFAAIFPTAPLPNGVEGITYKEVQFYSNKVNLRDPSLRWKVLQAPPGITIDEKMGSILENHPELATIHFQSSFTKQSEEGLI
jgi:hypothetical protein